MNAPDEPTGAPDAAPDASVPARPAAHPGPRQGLRDAVAAAQVLARLHHALDGLRGAGTLSDDDLALGLAWLQAGQAQWLAGDAPGAGQALRQVTVLFADVVGSTRLVQRLDPEQVHEILDGLLQALTRCVQQQGGRVLQYAGDSILAAWGTRQVHEDDPERAVLAGLAMLRAVAPFARRVRDELGHDGFDLRVGIHTGDVLLGGGVDAEHSIRGITVHLAARVEQNTAPGTLRISHDTWWHVRGLFAMRAQPPLWVKGRDEAVMTHLVEAPLPPGQRRHVRGVAGVAPPLLGRDAELARLRGALAEGPAPVVRRLVVLGEAGVGKSRLLAALRDSPEARHAHVLAAGARPGSAGQPYGLLRDWLAPLVGLDGGQTGAAARTALQAVVAPLFDEDGEAAAALLGHLLGLDAHEHPAVRALARDGRQLRARAFHTALRVLRTAAGVPTGPDARPQPLWLVLDDAHWADEGTLDFIAHLQAPGHDLDLRLLLLARPELAERRPDWTAEDQALAPCVRLLPLPPAASQALADALLARLPEPPEALRRLLAERAGGNPFFMEELLRMLIDDGAIETPPEPDEPAEPGVAGAPPWRLHPERLAAARVPTTLNAVLQARLDRLPPLERRALQAAAVLGMRCWPAGVAAIDAEAAPALPPLLRRGLLQPPDPAATDSPGLGPAPRFAHQLLQQVAYDSQLKTPRAQAHGRAARWLAAQPGAGDTGLLAEVAEHFERAGDLAEALDWRTRAAEQAAERYAHALVLSQVARALPLAARAGTSPEAQRPWQWRLHLARQRSHRVRGDQAGQDADLQALQALAEAADRTDWRATVALRRAVATEARGDPAATESAARRALALAEAAGDDAAAVMALTLLCGTLRLRGRHDEAWTAGQTGLARARALDQPMLLAELLSALSVVASERGDGATARALLAQCAEFNHRSGNLMDECATRINLGDVTYREGGYGEAAQHLEQALRLARRGGFRAFEAMALLNLASVRHHEGRDADALAPAEAACATADAVGHAEYAAFARLALGHVQLGLSRLAAARAAFAQAAAQLQAIGLAHLGVEAEAGLAEVALAEQRPAEALAHAERVLAQQARDGHLHGTEHPLQLLWVCHRVLAALGDARCTPLRATLAAELARQAPADATARAAWLAAVAYRRAVAAIAAGESGASVDTAGAADAAAVGAGPPALPSSSAQACS